MNKKEMISEIKEIVIEIFNDLALSPGNDESKNYTFDDLACLLYRGSPNYFSIDIYSFSIDSLKMAKINIKIVSQKEIQFTTVDYTKIEEIYNVIQKVKDYFKKEKKQKRGDTRIGTIEKKYGIDLGVRSDMKLSNYLDREGFGSLSKIIENR